jgi:tetratricopeptide (TPR) repeat protein
LENEFKDAKDSAEILALWMQHRADQPDRAAAFFWGARAFMRLKMTREAEILLGDAVAVTQPDFGVHREWVECAIRRHDWDAAAKRCDVVRSRFPEQPYAYVCAARASRELGRVEDAEAQLSNAVNRFPADAWPLIEWAECSFRRRDFQEALFRSRLISDRFPADRAGLVGIARALRDLGRFDEADRCFEESIVKFPRDVWPMIEWAGCPFHRRDFAEAARRCQKLRERFPDERFGYLGGARALRDQGRLTEADTLFSEARQRFPDDQQVADDWLAWLRHKRKHGHSSTSAQDGVTLRRVTDLGANGLLAEAADAALKLVEKSPSDAAVVEAVVDFCVLGKDLAFATRVWEIWLADEKLDREALATAARKLYPAFYRQQGSAIFISWIFWANGEEKWAVRGAQTIVWLLERHDQAAELRKPIWQIYWSLNVSKLHPFARAAFGSYFGDVLSADIYFEMIVKLVFVWSRVDGPHFGVFFVFGGIAENAIGYAPERTNNCNSGLEQAIRHIILTRRDQPTYPRELYLLLIIADSVDDRLRLLALELAMAHLPALADDGLATPQGVVRRIVELNSGSKIFSPALPSFRPRVCVEISGQLRGYQEAFKSWGNLGLDHAQTSLVAHVWSDIGGKVPEDPAFADRTFQGNFLRAYKSVLTEYGWPLVRERYPALIGGTAKSDVVTEQDIAELYHAAAIVIEDDKAGAAGGKSNQWKMHYKIYQAHQLALRVCPDCDIYVRIRPDFNFDVDLGLDWREIHEVVRGGRVMLAQFGRKLQMLGGTIGMGDQFAIGSVEAMTAYSEVFLDTAEAAKGHLFGFPTDFQGHLSVAYQTLYRGIHVRHIPRLTSGNPLLNPAKIAPSRVHQWLLEDCGGTARDPIDQRLLQAVEADLA